MTIPGRVRPRGDTWICGMGSPWQRCRKPCSSGGPVALTKPDVSNATEPRYARHLMPAGRG
jgi:hypothetical protein